MGCIAPAVVATGGCARSGEMRREGKHGSFKTSEVRHAMYTVSQSQATPISGGR